MCSKLIQLITQCKGQTKTTQHNKDYCNITLKHPILTMDVMNNCQYNKGQYCEYEKHKKIHKYTK